MVDANKKPQTPNYLLGSYFYTKGTFLLILILIVSTGEYKLKNALFNFSIEIIPRLQESFPQWGFKLLDIITILKSGIQFYYFVLFAVLPLNVSLLLLFNFSLTSYFAHFLKVFHHDSRPFWVSEDIRKFQCIFSYGSPSVHSAVLGNLLLVLGFLIVKRLKSFSAQMFACFTIAFLVFLTLFSRVIEGSHSIDQVLYGLFIGFTIFYFSCFMTRLYYMKDYQFAGLFLEWKSIANGISFLLTLVIISSLCFLYSNDLINPVHLNILKAKCGEAKTHKGFSASSFIDTLGIFQVIGAYFGLVCLFKVLYPKRLLDFNANCSFRKYFIILCSVFFFSASWYYIVDNISIEGYSPLQIYIWFTALPYFLVGFSNYCIVVMFSYVFLQESDLRENETKDEILFRKVDYA